MNAPGCEYALYVLSLDHRGFGSPALAENQQGSAVDVDQVLVMTVNPGFGHQHFLHSTLGKIHRVRRMIDRLKPGCDLEVDAGIDAETAQLCVEAGANVFGSRNGNFWNRRERGCGRESSPRAEGMNLCNWEW